MSKTKKYANFKFKPTKTTKKNEAIIAEDYMYYFKRLNTKTTLWNFSDKDCNSTITSNPDYIVEKLNGKKIENENNISDQITASYIHRFLQKNSPYPKLDPI